MDNFPQLVYNADETGLSSVPNVPSLVIARKGSRTVQTIRSGERGVLTTVIPSANACGDYMPPFVIIKGANVPAALREIYAKENMAVTATKSGYVDHEAFLLFLEHFNTHRVKIPKKKTVLILDGHASHMTVEAIEFCIGKGIELVCLPPHTTQRLQPLDTHFNAPLKREWAGKLEAFLLESDTIAVSKQNFAHLFISVNKTMSTKRGLIVDGFRHCGLFPLKNTVNASEMEMSRSFIPENDDRAADSHSATVARNVMKSPKKVCNPVHLKKHELHVTSPENLATKKARSLKVKLNFDKVVEKRAPMSKPRSSKDSNVRPRIHSANRGETSSAAQDVGKIQEECVVCQGKWNSATEDWLLCSNCGKWSCESCFGSNMCFFCE